MFGQGFVARQDASRLAAGADAGDGFVNDFEHFGVLGIAQVAQSR